LNTTGVRSPKKWAIYTLKEAQKIGLLIKKSEVKKRPPTRIIELSNQGVGQSRFDRFFMRIQEKVTSLIEKDNQSSDHRENTDTVTHEEKDRSSIVESLGLRKRKPQPDVEGGTTHSPSLYPPARRPSEPASQITALSTNSFTGTKDEKDKSAPNVSLNLGATRKPWELYTTAIVGVLVQLGVLVVAGMATYHPRWKFRKGGLTVKDYAYREYFLG
jgi:hypothetical protein